MSHVPNNLKRSNAWVAFKSSMEQGHTLYDQIRHIGVYKHHREDLRPWDRQLPVTVQHEANRRDLWRARPPSTLVIFLVLIGCIFICELIATLPFVCNLDFINSFWRDIDKPSILYHNSSVLFAVYIVVHLSTGFALWFIYLKEGFSKHQAELVPLALALVLECVWVDAAFDLGRLDITMIIACCVCVLIVVAQILLVLFSVHIAAIFLCPHLAGTIGVIVYVGAFINVNGATLVKNV